MKTRRRELHPVKIDPITVDMPMLTARFVRFETSEDGKRFYVVYEITVALRLAEAK